MQPEIDAGFYHIAPLENHADEEANLAATLYNRGMASSLPDLASRREYLLGLSIALIGAMLFSTKAIVAKLIYRYHVDAITLIAFRMLFSLPFFVAVAWWKGRGGAPLSGKELMRVIVLGLLGYYLSNFLDFLGLQCISAGLERLILFLTPTFVLLISAIFLKRRIMRLEWAALCTGLISALCSCSCVT